VELESGANKYTVQANDSGIYQFSNLPAGEYTLTIRVPGFTRRIVKSIGLLELEQKRIFDVPLDIGNCFFRDIILLPLSETFGRLTGSVDPPMAGIEVTLVCRTFSACASTTTDPNGRFSFGTLSPGVYGLSFRHEGFYPDKATGYGYAVNAGWESVYGPALLQQCPNGDCDPKRRPPQPVRICE